MVPIFDGHIHLIGEDFEDFEDYLAALLAAMDRHGAARAVVFGVHGDPACDDELALRAHARYPDRFLPFACEIDVTASGLANQVATKLADPSWRGLGEIFVVTKKPTTEYLTRTGEELYFTFPQPPRGPLDPQFREIFDACARHHSPVLVHCDDAAVMEQLLARHPETTFLWGHADWSQDDWTADRQLRRLQEYPNLYYEVRACLRSAAFWPENRWYLPDWYAGWIPVMEQFPGRITFGSDPYYWPHLEPETHADGLYVEAREVEKQLSPEAGPHVVGRRTGAVDKGGAGVKVWNVGTGTTELHGRTNSDVPYLHSRSSLLSSPYRAHHTRIPTSWSIRRGCGSGRSGWLKGSS